MNLPASLQKNNSINRFPWRYDFNVRIRREFLSFIIIFSASIVTIYAQSETEAYPRGKNGNLETVLTQPTQYTAVERTEIYLDHISQYLATNPDTTFILYQQMADYGKQMNDSMMITQAYGGISFMHQYKHNIDSGILYMRKALNYAHDADTKATTLGSLGNLLSVNNKIDSALYYADISLDIIIKNDIKPLLANAYLQKAEILKKQNSFNAALQLAINAVKTSEHNWTELKLSNAYQIISELYADIGDLDNAEKYIDNAIQICKTNNYERTLAGFLNKKATILKNKNSYQKAIGLYNSSLAYHKEKKLIDHLVNTYSNLAKCYLQLDDESKAKENLEKARKWIPDLKYEGNKLNYLSALGQYNIVTNNLSDATIAYKELISVGSQKGFDGQLINGHRGLKKVAEKKADWKTAYKQSEIVNQMESDLDIENQKSLMYDLEEKYKTELKNIEIQRLQTEKELKDTIISKKNRQLLFSILSLILAILAILGFYNAYKIKSKLNQKLTKSLDTNKMLIKEIHHRVKNNLQVVSSLLNIQSRYEKDDIVLKAINSGKYRVQSMSLLHQNLYKNEDLNYIKVQKYFSDLIHSLVEGYPLENKNIKLDLNIENIELDVDTLVPLGLIANELVTNSLKYAFHEDRAVYLLKFTLRSVDDKVEMICSDNGSGLPFDIIPTKTKSMGMQLIRSFTDSLDATVAINNSNGAAVKITFTKPKQEKLSLNAVS